MNHLQRPQVVRAENFTVQRQSLEKERLEFRPRQFAQYHHNEGARLHELERKRVLFAQDPAAGFESLAGERLGLGNVASPPVGHGQTVE